MNDLARWTQDFQVVTNDTFSWATIGQYSAAFLQRPFLDKHITVMKLFKDQDIPVWVDYDDYLFDVPIDNPCYGTYMTDETRRNVAKIINMADVVTVTTKHLKRLIQKPLNSGKILNDRVYVVPNGPLPWHAKYGRANDPKKCSFLWRGSPTHQRDLMDVTDDILDFNKKDPTDFTFIGYNPWWMTELMGDNCTVAPPVPIDNFYQAISTMNPSFVVVPLHPCDFNKAKSSIAYVEATIAGAVTIAPDWEEWRRPGVITYDPLSEGSFKEALVIAKAMSAEERARLHKMAAEHVWGQMSVASSRKLRNEIALALMDVKNPWPKGGEPEAEDDSILEMG